MTIDDVSGSFEEAEKYMDKYIDELEKFHKNTMSFIDSLDVSKDYDRVKGAEELQDLIKQGEQIREFVLDGNVYTTD